MKNYVGIARDHSGSMQSLRKTAMADYNSLVEGLTDAAVNNGIDTVATVVELGVRTANGIRVAVQNSAVQALKPLTTYSAEGGTPLYDAVGQIIENFKRVPDADDPNVTFLVMAVTDGEENQSRAWNARSLSAEIKRLQATDRWTFVFRVPRGYGWRLKQNLDVFDGNVQEWEVSERGMQQSGVQTRSAVSSYYSGVSSGQTSTKTFFTNIVQPTEVVKAALVDIKDEVKIMKVTDDQIKIRDFVEGRLKKPMLRGAAFYELQKKELVQESKVLMVKERNVAGGTFFGPAARDLLGLPQHGDVKVAPGQQGKFDVFVQSTSVNRLLPVGSRVLYWEKVGKEFLEGPSSKSGKAKKH